MAAGVGKCSPIWYTTNVGPRAGPCARFPMGAGALFLPVCRTAAGRAVFEEIGEGEKFE
ncbi:hypothetical protein HMPREF0262_00107 [Clostridium sp. ATCC 29733]|nr:hypothetical protein HMPREF0262_00107 [Clostridium sp. ATCC 29733]